jgi:hypothetical protein
VERALSVFSQGREDVGRTYAVGYTGFDGYLRFDQTARQVAEAGHDRICGPTGYVGVLAANVREQTARALLHLA